ncbi:MAG: 4Fe-4S binding protein [Ignavibacteriales bacterium]|nr:4Fe-4S binding protein [Ignavibacteriales bacterium]
MSKLVYLKNVVTLKLDSERCNGCRMCIEVCPHDVFGIANKRAFIKNKDYCMECGACANNCCEGAIYVKSGVGCATGILNGFLRGGEPTCDCSSDASCC